MPTPQATISQQQTIIDALTAQIETAKADDRYFEEEISDKIRSAFPGVKYRGEGFLRALIMDACSLGRSLRADLERLKEEHAKVLAESKTTVARHDEGKPITRGEALGLTIQDYGDRVAVTKAIDDSFTRLRAAEFERDRLSALVAKRADEIVEIDGLKRQVGDLEQEAKRLAADLAVNADVAFKRGQELLAAQELLRVAKVENERLLREQGGCEAQMPSRSGLGPATIKQIRKDLTRANAGLAEIRRLVKAQGKESAVEAVRRHFGEYDRTGSFKHNLGSFFKDLRKELGIPPRDHGGLDGILKAVENLKARAQLQDEVASTSEAVEAFDPDALVGPVADHIDLHEAQGFAHTANRRIAEAICVVAAYLVARDPLDVSEDDHAIRISLRRALSLAESLSDLNDDRGFGSTT